MVSAVLALFSGAMAGLEGAALSRYVLLNVAMDYWTKRRNKPKEDKRSTPSSQGSGNVSSGDVIPVVFGLASLEGQVFDVINREDGGYPVFGALGFCFPKSYGYGFNPPYSGVDLVDRDTVAFTSETEGEFGGILNQFTLIPRTDTASKSVEPTSEVIRSLKWGNDATKVLNNVWAKFFNAGGFANQHSTTLITVKDGTNSSLITSLIVSAGYVTAGSGGWVPLGGAWNASVTFSLDTTTGPFAGHTVDEIRAGDLLRVVVGPSGSQKSYLWDIQSVTPGVSYGHWESANNGEYGGDIWVIDTTDWSKISLTVYMTVAVVDITFAEIIHFDASVVYRSPDFLLQFDNPGYKNNNKLAWLAEEIRDPGNAYQNITTEVAGASALIFDGCMPACETVLVDGVHTFKDLVSGYVDNYPTNINGIWSGAGKYLCNNPIAIIYEILVNDSFGAGWPVDRIHIDSFVEAYIYCYTYSETVGSVNWKFGGYVLSSQSAISEVIDDILNHIHIDRAFTQDNQIRLFINNGNVSTAKTLDMSVVMTKDGEEVPIFKVSTTETSDVFNVLKVSYFRPDREFLFDTFLKITDFADIQFSQQVKEELLELPGFMETRYAKKSALWHMNRQLLETEFYEAEVDIIGQNFEVGDVVRIVARNSDYDWDHADNSYPVVDGYFEHSGKTYLAFNRTLSLFTKPTLLWADVINPPALISEIGTTSGTLAYFKSLSYPAENSYFKVYDYPQTEHRYFKCLSVTSELVEGSIVYTVTFDTEVKEIIVGDVYQQLGDSTYVTNAGINGPVDSTAPDIFFHPGVFVIELDTIFGSTGSTLGKPVTFKRLKGFRCLGTDRFARVVEVKDSNEFKSTLSLRQYSPDAYDGSGSGYQVEAPVILNKISNPASLAPRSPSFSEINVRLFDSGVTVLGAVDVKIQSIPTPENAKIVVKLYFEDPSTLQQTEVDTKTLYRGEYSVSFFNLPVYEAGSTVPLKFFADAVAYNRDGLSSSRVDSRAVLLALDPVRYPNGYAVVNRVGVVYKRPPNVEFDPAGCEYSDRIVLTSYKYTIADVVRLEVRNDDTEEPAQSNVWGIDNNNAASDASFVTSGESQILLEQKNLTTTARTLTFYIRAYNKIGQYSVASGVKVLTNAMPAPVNESKYSVTVVNNIAKFSVSGFDDGAGQPGSTIPKDIIGYELFIGGSTTPLFFSASTEFEYALDFNEFSGSDSVVKNFKILAHDRISYTLPSGEDRATRLNATSAKEVTFYRLESAALALDALRSGTSDNKLKLLWVKDDGTEAGDYKSTFGKLMATNSYPYRQSLILEDGKTYVLSFYAKSTYGNEVKIVIDGNGPSLAEASTTSTTRTLVTYKFTTNVNVGTTPATTFSAYGVGEIYEIMLNEGDHAHTYSLHKDDELDNLGNREYKAQQAAIIEAINSNHAALLAKFDEDGARIDMTEDEIILRVKKDDVLNSIMLSEEAVSISGKNIIIDGLTRFMNSTDTIYGGVIESDGSTYAVLYNQANKTDPTGLNRLYSFNKTTGLLEKEFTFTGVTINPANKRKLTLTGISVVTGAFPAVDDFLTENNSDKGTTTIDGGRITANTVTADKILAKTIGAEKLIAREILAQIIQVIGKNTIVLSEKDGILVYPQTAYSSPYKAKIIDNKTLVLLNVALTPYAGDYAKIGYNQGGSGFDRGVFYGLNLRAIGYGSHQEGPEDPTYPSMIFDDVTPPFVGIDYESSDALVMAQFLDVSTQSKYVQISASVPDPLDGNTQKPGIRIVSGGGVEAVWTVDNFYLNSPNSLIKSANLEGGTIDIGADLVGTPDESFHVGSDGKMWIGSESYDTAPFKVDETGAVKAVALSVENVTSMPAYYNFLSKTASVSMTTADTNTQKAETLMVVTQPTPTTWPNTSRMKSILFSFFVTHTHPFPGSYKLYAGVISDYWAALSRGDFAYYSGVGSSLYIRRATDLHEYTLGTVTSNVSDPTSSLLPVTVSNFPSMGGKYLPDGYLSGLKVEFSLPGKGKRVAYIRDNSSASVGSPQANIYLHEIFSGHPSSDFYEDLSMIPSGMSEVSIVNDSMSVQATGSAWSTYSTNQGLFTSAGIGSTYGKYAGFILKFRNPSTGGVCLFRINQTWSGGTSDTLLIEVDTSAIFSKVVPLGISAGTSVVIKDCRDEIDKMYTQTSAMKAFPISGQTLSRSGASTYNYTADLTITAEILYDLPVDTI